jgi:DNA repair protein RadA/Sms
VLLGVKNRFGAVDETGLFAMAEEGLLEVKNPAGFLLGERVVAPGSVLTAVLEGSRPVLVEIQALTVPTVFGYPRRTVSGFDLNRLNLLLAVLQRRAGIDLSSHDVFVNVVGGLKVKDPAVDAAICVAIASARQGTAIAEKLVIVGEVGNSSDFSARTTRKRSQTAWLPSGKT